MDFLQELKSLRDQVFFDERIPLPSDYDKIVIAGMGGSGISGKIFQELYTKEPVIVLDDYSIPEFVNGRTLFISMSYSGNTEEVLSATEAAKKRGCKVVGVTSGGRLADMCDHAIKLPGGLQPRSSLGYMLMPLLNSFMGIGSESLERVAALLEELDDDNEAAAREAERIFEGERIPVTYGFSPYRSVAYRWKTQFNENSKVMAFSNYFPELDHNEIIPLKSTYGKSRFIFYTFGKPGNERISLRMDGTGKVSGVTFNVIQPKGESTVERLFYLIHYGDYLTYHLAKLRKVDPEDVSAIEDLKKILKP